MSRKSPMPQIDPSHEKRLVDRVIAGDEDAFAEIHTMYSARVFAFCLKRVKDYAEAEDLAQETFVQLFRSLDSFEGRSSLLTWTFGIAHNVCFRYYRHCSRWMVGGRNSREIDERGSSATTERQIDAERVLDRCEEVLESARRPAHQEIFHLRYGEGKSIKAIAEEVGKSKEAVKVSLRRSRTALASGVPELDTVLENIAQSA